METDNRSLHDLMQNALWVQSSPLATVLFHFHRDFARLNALMFGKWDYPHRHPMAIIYGGRIAQLTGSEISNRFSQAIEWATKVVNDGNAWVAPPTDNN